MTPKKPPKQPTDVVAEWAAEHGVNLKHEVVALDRIHPNPWNPNVMDDRTRGATNESIAMFGFIDWPHVRRHPELDGHFQLIDGEHRVTEARELGLSSIPVVVMDIDTPTAMKLTVVLNQRGTNDDVRLGALLGELRGQGGEDWAKALAFDPATLDHLIELGAASWTPPDGEGGLGAGAGTGTGGDGDEWRTIVARVPAAVEGLWGEARDRAAAAGDVGAHDDETVAAGMLLEVLVASYLASAQAEDAARDEGTPPDAR